MYRRQSQTIGSACQSPGRAKERNQSRLETRLNFQRSSSLHSILCSSPFSSCPSPRFATDLFESVRLELRANSVSSQLNSCANSLSRSTNRYAPKVLLGRRSPRERRGEHGRQRGEPHLGSDSIVTAGIQFPMVGQSARSLGEQHGFRYPKPPLSSSSSGGICPFVLFRECPATKQQPVRQFTWEVPKGHNSC